MPRRATSREEGGSESRDNMATGVCVVQIIFSLARGRALVLFRPSAQQRLQTAFSSEAFGHEPCSGRRTVCSIISEGARKEAQMGIWESCAAQTSCPSVVQSLWYALKNQKSKTLGACRRCRMLKAVRFYCFLPGQQRESHYYCTSTTLLQPDTYPQRSTPVHHHTKV